MSNRLYSAAAPVTAHSAAATLPFPPVRAAGIGFWNRNNAVVPELDVIITGDGSVSVTNGELISASLTTLVIADDTVDTVDTTDNEFDIASHAYLNGDGPVRVTSSGTMPGGLDSSTDYYIILVSSGAIALATTRDNALAGTKIDLTSAGSGTITIADTADTKRLVWTGHGMLGYAADGAFAVTATKGIRFRAENSPDVVAYAMVGTLSASTVTVAIVPVVDNA
jgi:hypothetical protein